MPGKISTGGETSLMPDDKNGYDFHFSLHVEYINAMTGVFNGLEEISKIENSPRAGKLFPELHQRLAVVFHGGPFSLCKLGPFARTVGPGPDHLHLVSLCKAAHRFT